MADNKKTASLILASMGPKKEEEGEMSGRQMAADEILKAIESKDSMALADALGSFMDQGPMEEEPEEAP